MSFHIIIPARYHSTRLPGKPLLDIIGKPMIQRVYECASHSDAESLVVATDDQRIVDVVASFGGRAVMTRADHESGTDRLQEVVSILALPPDDIVVNVQGDEPLIPSAVINQVAKNLAMHPEASVATLSEPLESVEQVFDPNVVKVVADIHQLALYFSRAPIPWDRNNYQSTPPSLPDGIAVQRHIGLYAYRVDLLHKFVTWPLAALESIEKLEQLRVLANGHRIHIAEACEPVPGGIDTQSDLQRVRELLNNKAYQQAGAKQSKGEL